MKLTKHLLLAAGLLLAVVAVLVVRSWGTFALMVDNVTAMSEGRQIARQIRYPTDLLAYVAVHPEDVSLVAYDLDAQEEGIFFQAARARPLVRVSDLLLLAEYARRTAHGLLDPARRVPIDALARYALPGAGASRHEKAQRHWRAKDYVDADSTVALRHVIEAISRFNDGAAADWFIAELGRREVEALPERFGLDRSEPPMPGSGLHLSWSVSTERGPVADRLTRFDTLTREAYVDRVYGLARRLRNDASFRHRERVRLDRRGAELSIRDQRALAQATYPRGTAADYAEWMRRVAQGELHSDSVSTFLQRRMERAVAHDSVAVTFTVIGSEAGALPGIISFVGYLRRRSGPPSRVAAFFMERLPIGFFYHLVQTGLDKGFLLQLLSDDAFFRRVRTRLRDSTVAATP